MARTHRVFRCSSCGYEAPAFSGRCSRCQEWNTLEERSTAAPVPGRTGAGVRPDAGKAVPLRDVDDDVASRLVTGIEEFDRVLGGGLVPGSLVLIGGEPGIGKSTLMLQGAAALAGRGNRLAYVCGEESPRQVKLRATRLGVAEAAIDLLPETNLDAALALAEGLGADALVIDSIQSVYVEGLDTRFAGPAQLAEAGARLVSWSKRTGTATLLTGHVTKTGEVAGPRLLEHLVDAVLYFESAESGALRVLRAVKNRFGATDEVGVFEMTGEGLASIENPSSVFLAGGGSQASGCAITATIEGSRPIAVEVQALAVASNLSAPRRIAAGIETSRLHLLLAVLARRGARSAATMDVVASVSGGLRLRDPSADLATLAALASAIDDRPIVPGTAFLGEVALSGAVRPVQQPARRIGELARVGVTRVIAPAGLKDTGSVRIVPVTTVRQALAAAFEG